MDKIKENIGFENRIFLSKEEWETYLRRKPVRYIRKKKPDLCEICNKPPTKDDPLENSHIIGFRIGIIYFGLTPDYVDNNDNIVSAHKRICNKSAELDLFSVCKELKNRGIISIPEYLPSFIKDMWERI